MNCKKILLIILFLGLTTYAHAGYYVYHVGSTITGKQGPCGRVCRTRIDALSVDEVTYQSATKRTHKVVGGVVVAKTQIEINAYDAAIQAAADAAELARIAALDDKISATQISDAVLTKADNAIDNIGDLSDAKVFLKKLCRYIVSNQ